MDRANLRDLHRLSPDGARTALFLADAEVPDPYYGGEEDFERVVELSRAGAASWIERLRGR
jgi:protein-tyrosine phosphatase